MPETEESQQLIPQGSSNGKQAEPTEEKSNSSNGEKASKPTNGKSVNAVQFASATETEQYSPDAYEEETEKEHRSCPEFFGVRSYLHTFYESMSVKNPQMYEDTWEQYYANQQRSRNGCNVLLWWKVVMWTGINVLLFGAIILIMAYAYPRRSVVVSQHDETEIIDKAALSFNRNLDMGKIIGLVLFCVGGLFLILALLLPSLTSDQIYDRTREVENMENTVFELQVAAEEDPSALNGSTDSKIPATEELKSVQPKRGLVQEMVVMTNNGLCKVPVE